MPECAPGSPGLCGRSATTPQDQADRRGDGSDHRNRPPGSSVPIRRPPIRPRPKLAQAPPDGGANEIARGRAQCADNPLSQPGSLQQRRNQTDPPEDQEPDRCRQRGRATDEVAEVGWRGLIPHPNTGNVIGARALRRAPISYCDQQSSPTATPLPSPRRLRQRRHPRQQRPRSRRSRGPQCRPRWQHTRRRQPRRGQ